MLIFFLSLFSGLIIGLYITNIILGIQFRNWVLYLFSLSKNFTTKNYHKTQLDGLPIPVQKYFNLVLTENQPYISFIRFTHKGFFKTGIDKNWVPILGVQYVSVQNPGFIWKGTTSFFTAIDSYVDKIGNLKVSLLSIFKIIDKKGASYNHGELLRWLGESVLYPTNLLPSEQLKWTAIDEQTANLTFMYHQELLQYKVIFNDKGEIIELQSKRYMDENNLETWIIKLSNYKMINQVLIPTDFEVIWQLPQVDFSYAKFTLQTIEYNTPKLF